MNRHIVSRRRFAPFEYCAGIFAILCFGIVWEYQRYIPTVLSGLFIIFILKKFLASKLLASWLTKPNAVDNMTGLQFEKYVAERLRQQGYTNVQLTEEYDLGVDIIAVKNNVRWGIQVKRYSGMVGADSVRQVVTALNTYRCDRAMVITNSNFSKPAKLLASSNNCFLIERFN